MSPTAPQSPCRRPRLSRPAFAGAGSDRSQTSRCVGLWPLSLSTTAFVCSGCRVFGYSRCPMSRAAGGREREHGAAGELEVDLGQVWRSVVARWWLPLIGLVVGAVAGLLVSFSGGKQWKAVAQVYLGTPIAAGAPVLSPATSVGLATAFINSEYALRHAARASGITPARLSGNISVQPILGVTGTKTGQSAPLLLISVIGSNADRTQIAANDLSALVVRRFEPSTAREIAVVKARLAQELSQAAGIHSRLTHAEGEQSGVVGSTPQVANWAQVITSLSSQLFTAQAGIAVTRTLIAQLQSIEQPRIVAPAIAAGGSRSHFPPTLIGAAIGFLLGLLAATVWDPLRRSTRPRQATP